MDNIYYFLDTNFIRQMSRYENTELVEWVIRFLQSPDHCQITPVATIFSRMEAIGIKPPTFSYQIPISYVNNADMSVILVDIKRSALEFFQNSVVLSEVNIRQKLNETRHYIHPKFIQSGLFLKHIDIRDEEIISYRKNLCELLAVNALHAFDYPDAIRGAMHVIHAAAIIEEFKDNRNLCLLRSFRFFWNHQIREKRSVAIVSKR